MYRFAVELSLKALVLGEASNFLAVKPDALSIHKTHSVSWLAQFVCQIIAAVKREKEFNCKGIENLADFRAVVDGLSAVDPGSYVFQLPVGAERDDAAPRGDNPPILDFARRMDALLELLDSTANALAEEWDMRLEEPTENENGGGFRLIIN